MYRTKIADLFMEPLYNHLKAEPGEIVGLAKYSTAERPIDTLGIADTAGKCTLNDLSTILASEFNQVTALRQKQVNLGFMLNTLPVFFETIEFEGGMWHGVFPPLKGLAKTIMNKAVPKWHSGRWRFVSCDAEGRVKYLAV